jgi:hypothetical protein
MGERLYRFTFSCPPALVGGQWSASRPCRFTPRVKNPQYTLYRRLGGPQSLSGRYGQLKSVMLRLTVSQYVLVSGPLWHLWPDITFCLKAVLSLWGALSDERSGSVSCQSLSAIFSLLSKFNFLYILHVTHVLCMFSIYKASVSPGHFVPTARAIYGEKSEHTGLQPYRNAWRISALYLSDFWKRNQINDAVLDILWSRACIAHIIVISFETKGCFVDSVKP